VFDAVEHVVTWGLEHRTLGQIDAIGVDEIQYSKGHKYQRSPKAFEVITEARRSRFTFCRSAMRCATLWQNSKECCPKSEGQRLRDIRTLWDTKTGSGPATGINQLIHFKRDMLVGPAGIEPATLGLEIRCSIRLSYGPSLMFHEFTTML
jgi:hypothetical protein